MLKRKKTAQTMRRHHHKGGCLYWDISNSDNEETRKAAAHEKACQSDVLYAAWQDKQIH